MIEYVLNRNPHSKRLHVRVDGMSRESCNLDQLKRFSVFIVIPYADVDFHRCQRCMPVLPGEGSAEVAQ